ncbi:MAG: molecular chaperone TorD family protein [Clostridium sp.]
MNNNELLKEYMDYRCGIYFWLRNLYISEPTVEILSDIVQTCREFGINEDSPAYEKEFIYFFANLSKEDIENTNKELKSEYARLFLGPKRILAPPYESVYCTRNRQLFGETCISVRRLYEQLGLKINKVGNVPDDFIGFELEFMYYLAFTTGEVINDNNMDKIDELLNHQYNFIKDHIGVWIERFTNDIYENTKMEYFKVIANFTKEFILEDYKSLSELK